MPDVVSRREGKPVHPRGERVLPGLFRLRLPLPWPGVPHCNAWAVAAGDGFVLFDTGMHEPDSISHLERALEMCNLRLEQARLVVCTHAHTDHCGQAPTIAERAGCEVWMHPNHKRLNEVAEDPDAMSAARMEIARQSGVPEKPPRSDGAGSQAQAPQSKPSGSGLAGPIMPDRDLLNGVTIATDLGEWVAYETPGHAPSHVCLFQPERRLLVSGDHLLGRISLYFDYGYSPDPVGEFLSSLDVVERLGARLCLAGHGRTFTDVHAHIRGNRELVEERLQSVHAAVDGRELTVFEIVPRVFGDALSDRNTHWLLSKILCYLTHLQALGKVHRIAGEPERWTA
jgi:glyoxylase-like metal-dependent hydrolase (beta-lactamase superfamily II)